MRSCLMLLGAAGNWSPIAVPAEWVMQSYSVTPNAYAGYMRTFDIPKDWTGKVVKLRFDGVVQP